MKKSERAELDAAYLDELIEAITAGANGEEEQLRAFRQAFENDVAVPCEATVIGEPVEVIKFDYDGNQRRGLTATCRGADGTKHVVAAFEMAIPPSAQGGHYLAAYRKWMGLAPFPAGSRGKTRRQPGAAALELDGPVELVVLSVRQKAARCRLLGSDRTLTLRAGRLWDVAPGEIAVVRPAKQWTYGGNPYLSGAIESARLDAKALGLIPLRLE
ncbi:MAG: cytoplasmic protein, partial [Acidobacteria bacterium]|nr:cytoplasmic protein [Acidobacteriota bacterium]